MAAKERAESEFTSILNSVDRKFDIIDVKWIESKFEIKFRTQIERQSEDFNALCDEWVDLFSEVTNTIWVKKISNTGPKIRFRKQYQCWTQRGKAVQKELLFDSKRCKGTLDIKVLTDNPFTRRKNKHIRLGLNVVVKINFSHLHAVDVAEPYAFFVHHCEPQPESPKPAIINNDRLPQLVAEMIQKGRNASPKIRTLNPPFEESSNNNDTKDFHAVLQLDINSEARTHLPSLQLETVDKDPLPIFENHLFEELDKNTESHQQHHLIHGSLHLPNMQPQTIQLLQNVPIQNMEAIKLELPPHLQQYTQVVVSDMSEPLLMCQSLMFDTSQVIPVSTHTLPSHFLQIHPQNN